MTTSAARLTIAVLARNRPGYLRIMLESLLAAEASATSITDATVVVVRDHSDDDRCKELVEELQRSAPNGTILRHLHARPRGQRENVLGAVEACETEFLSIVNDDDVCEANYIDELLSPLLADDTLGFCIGNVTCVDPEGKALPRMAMAAFDRRQAIVLETVAARARFHAVERTMRPFMGTIFRMTVLRGMTLPAEAGRIPDLWVGRHLVDTAERGWCTDAPVFRYRIHPESVSGALDQLTDFRWSMEQFLADPAFASFGDELRTIMREYERMVLLGQFASGVRSPPTVERILELSGTAGIRGLVMRLALRPPFAAATAAYLRFSNPRLRRVPADRKRGFRTPAIIRKALSRQ